MIDYAIGVTATGQILQTHSSPVAPDALPDGWEAVVIPDGTVVGNKTHIIVDHALAPYSATFADNKAVISAKAAQAYNSHFMGAAVFTYNGAAYQINAAGMNAIDEAGGDAERSLRDPITFPWDSAFYFIAADNSRVVMTAAQMSALSAKVTAYARQCRYRFRAIKDAISAAADQSALDAIDVTSGYPVASA